MQDKFKFTLTGAIVFLGISILLGSCQISQAIKNAPNNIYTPDYKAELNDLNRQISKLVEVIGEKEK